MTSTPGLLTLIAILLLTGALGVWWRVRSGRLRQQQASSAPVLSAEQIGAALGERATLVQFSSAFCQPCRTTRLILAQVSEDVPGVRHVEIDAESNLGLVRELDILRTPTVLILDRAGRVAFRASGAPRRDQVHAVLGRLDGAA